MAEVLILTGPPGAGKSAVAEALAERYDRVAHVDVNVVRRFVVAGRVAPWREGPEWQRQHRLAVRNAGSLATNFIAEKIGVIIDDVVDRESLAWYLNDLRGLGVPVHLVCLMPDRETCLARDRQRASGRARDGWVAEVHRRFEVAGPLGGATIDSSRLSVNETADRLQALTTRGESLVFTPARL
jgi:chloramphenicol 3-O-phosphotransferase